MKTKIISAFPCCGKTYISNNQSKYNYSMLDLDSSQFSWDVTFPNNYINHIIENIGKVNIIFVSTHLSVRGMLKTEGIDYITIYPERKCKSEWIRRMYRRGNDDRFISYMTEHYDRFLDEIESGPHGNRLIYLKEDEYIEDYIDEIMRS